MRGASNDQEKLNWYGLTYLNIQIHESCTFSGIFKGDFQ
jgi:hypothetical protein